MTARDQTRLLRGCCLDILPLRAAFSLSQSARQKEGPGSAHSPTTSIVSRAYPRIGMSNEQCAQLIRAVAFKFARLGIDTTEIALMAAILLMSPGECSFFVFLTVSSVERTHQ